MWVSLAASHWRNEYAQEHLDVIAKNMTPPEQLAEAKRLAGKWKPASAPAALGKP